LKVVFTENGPSVEDVHPFLIGNFTTERKDVIVEPLVELASKELPGVWSDFYRTRYSILSEFMESTKMYTVMEETEASEIPETAESERETEHADPLTE
jgi:hypothetical protein